MMKKSILVIDDDLKVCRDIKYALQDNEATDVYYALSAQDALETFLKHRFCLVIMDVRLTETDGVELLRTMRQAKPIPILVLSAKVSPSQRTALLHAGANGYLEKPYDLEECLAQAEALIRLYLKANPLANRCYTLAFGVNLIIDPVCRQATLNGEPLDLTRKEFDLLLCLASHAGQVLSREQLYGQVWDSRSDYSVDEVVKAHIKSLRKKLTPSGKEYIKNVWGVGYYFAPDPMKGSSGKEGDYRELLTVFVELERNLTRIIPYLNP